MPPASNDGSSNLSYSTEHSYPQSAPANKTSYHRSVSPPQPQRRSQSPPLKNGPGGGAKLQGRSLSASATPTRSPQPPATPRSPDSGGDARLRTPSPQLDERSRRNSDLDGASKEDEDLPLAMWQHQYHVQQNHQRERERERAIRR